MRERIRRGASIAAAAALLGAGSAAGAAGRADPPRPGGSGPGAGAGDDAPTGSAGSPPASGAASDGGAASDTSSVIAGPSTCPLPDVVWAELGTLVPRERLRARLRAIAGPTARVEIVDLGVPYRVIAAGRVREYRDEARDCGHRARVAAVFVALAIDPADVMAAAPAAAAAPPPVPTPAPAASSRVSTAEALSAVPSARAAAPPPVARVQVGATVDAAVDPTAPNARGAEAGIALRIAIGRGAWAVTAGAAALAPVDTSVGGLAVRQRRAPADLGVRARLGGTRRFEPYGELGLGAALLSESARDLASSATRTSVEIGARAAVGAHLVTSGRFAAFAALQAEWVPDPPSVFALPRGVVGHTPHLWIGATAGAAVGFF